MHSKNSVWRPLVPLLGPLLGCAALCLPLSVAAQSGGPMDGATGNLQASSNASSTASSVPVPVAMMAPGESAAARLMDRLQLRDDQLASWSQYVARLDAYSRTFYDEKPVSVYASEAGPHQIGRLVDNLSNRLAALEEVESAAKALYAVLTPVQQKVADQYLASSVPVLGTGFASPLNADVPVRQNKDTGSHGRHNGGGMGGIGGIGGGIGGIGAP